MFQKTDNVFVFVRSLRTTGCLASMAIFADLAAVSSLSQRGLEILVNCGTTIILVDDIVGHRHNYMIVRFRLIYEFLLTRWSLFDRVLVIDLFDTFVQGDPFHRAMDRSVVILSQEKKRCDPRQRRTAIRITHKPTVFRRGKCFNAGTQIGTAQMMLRLYKAYCKFLWRHRDIVLDDRYFFIDQVIMNLVIIHQHAAEAGVRVVPHMHAGDYITVADCLGWAGTNYTMGELCLRKDVYPLVIHLYDRSWQLCSSARQVCPSVHPVDDTIRCNKNHTKGL
jgi:hypothetical protein